MRDEETIRKMCDALSDYWDTVRKDEELSWKANHLRDQINVLEWVLEYTETEDVFDEDVITLASLEEETP